MKTVITGASGLIGRALLTEIGAAVVLSRDPVATAAKLGDVTVHRWNAAEAPAPREALAGAEVVFHLAGEPVAGRWSKARKRRIRDSRVVGTRNLVQGLAQLERPPDALVSASAVGVYGDRGDEQLDEGSELGGGFLAEVCADWEREALTAEALGIRVACVRIGVVLASGGGALDKMLGPFKMGIGGRLGDGTQWMPWVHVDDVVGIMLHAARSDEVRGAINAVAPKPVTNAQFTNALGRALNRPTLLPMPKLALRVAFGEMSEVLTTSQRVLPQVAARTNYSFQYAALDAALAQVLA